MLRLARVTPRRPSAALIISIIALVFSVTGAAVAAGVLPTGSVDTAQVVDQAITAEKLRDISVTAPKIRGNAVDSTKVANGSLRAVDFAAGQIGANAYARVAGGASPEFTKKATKRFSAVTHPATGTYCLTPATDISPAEHPAVVSVQPAGPLRPVAVATVVGGEQPAGCSPGDYKVVTYRIFIEAFGGPAPADDVPFSIIVA